MSPHREYIGSCCSLNRGDVLICRFVIISELQASNSDISSDDTNETTEAIYATEMLRYYVTTAWADSDFSSDDTDDAVDTTEETCDVTATSADDNTNERQVNTGQ